MSLQSYPFYIIAEIGVNYYDIATQKNISPMEAAKLMILQAYEGGAHAAKFQSYKAHTIASKNSPAYWDRSEEPTGSQFELFQKFDQFGPEEYAELAAYSKEVGIDFMSTPFDLDAVDFLDSLMPYYKVASADITNIPMLRKIAAKKKPIILSTGASYISEIRSAINTIRDVSPYAEISLLHCVLSYPTANKDANLDKINQLKTEFPEYGLGYSDHTLPDSNMAIVSAAYAMGAKIIEKHFTLDKSLQGNDHYHAMDVEDLKKFRSNLEVLSIALSKSEKNFLDCEKTPRLQARRSIVVAKDLKKGHVLTEEDLIPKRPGTGMPISMWDEVLNKTLIRDVKEDDLLSFNDFE